MAFADRATPRALGALPGVRVLIVCAAIGEGHVTVAARLARDLHARPDVAEVIVREDLGVLGERFGAFMERGFHVHVERIGWSYELAYRLFFELAPARRAGQLALTALGGHALARTIAASRADVVVAEYPLFSAVLGELRRRGRLAVPVCSSISDPAGLHYWAHPGIDLHLLSWAESLAEVDAIAGPGRARAVVPLVADAFLQPPDRAVARRALELPAGDAIVLVSGGGWGVGDLGGAADAALRLADADDAALRLAGLTVVVLTGRNERLAASLRARFAVEPRVRVLGFTERMAELLAATDVLVHTTGGTTALEARVTGCPLINYGPLIAHARPHAETLERLGVAQWARTPQALRSAIARALASGRRPPLDCAALPQAAELVVELARMSSDRASGRAPNDLAPSERPLIDCDAR